jgi:hypothetical protein
VRGAERVVHAARLRHPRDDVPEREADPRARPVGPRHTVLPALLDAGRHEQQ